MLACAYASYACIPYVDLCIFLTASWLHTVITRILSLLFLLFLLNLSLYRRGVFLEQGSREITTPHNPVGTIE